MGRDSASSAQLKRIGTFLLFSSSSTMFRWLFALALRVGATVVAWGIMVGVDASFLLLGMPTVWAVCSTHSVCPAVVPTVCDVSSTRLRPIAMLPCSATLYFCLLFSSLLFLLLLALPSFFSSSTMLFQPFALALCARDVVVGEGVIAGADVS